MKWNENDAPYRIRFAYKDEWNEIIALVWKTFLRFEAPDYSREGIKNFNDFITDHTLFRMFEKGYYRVMVALEEKQIVGVISVRDSSHISLLFVAENVHKRGLGKRLIEEMVQYLLSEEGITRITVNSSPYALDFYRKIGFRDIGFEQLSGGIRFTPMELYF